MLMISVLILLLILSMIGSLPTAIGDLTYAYARVEIVNCSFVPDNVAVYKNSTVVWVNNDMTGHILNIGDRRTPYLSPGESYTISPKEFGTYSCHCDDAKSGSGIIIVR